MAPRWRQVGQNARSKSDLDLGHMTSIHASMDPLLCLLPAGSSLTVRNVQLVDAQLVALPAPHAAFPIPSALAPAAGGRLTLEEVTVSTTGCAMLQSFMTEMCRLPGGLPFHVEVCVHLRA